MSSSTTRGVSRIAFLDFLRIFAFVSVLVGHEFEGLIQRWIDNPSVHATPKVFLQALHSFYEGGGAGVVVFFLVSGYIITHVLGTENAGVFAIRRFFRIYPLYWAAVIIELIVVGVWPGFKVFLSRICLVGDFFGTPYGLGRVEWTLRIELLFYLLMTLLKIAGLFDTLRRHLYFAFVVLIVLFGIVSPFPNQSWLFVGYCSIYLPFLFVGSCFYLREKGEIGASALVSSIILCSLQYFWLISRYQPLWLSSHFMISGLAVFVLMWFFRGRLVTTPLVRFFSDLTFSVYLFHKWMWLPLLSVVDHVGLLRIPKNLQVLILLGLICVCLSKTIEIWGIKVGRELSDKLRPKAY